LIKGEKIGEENNGDFLGCLIQDEKNKIISTEELHQCVLEMLLAGTDTSSVTLFYLLVSLTEQLDTESKIRQEIFSVTSNNLGLPLPFI